MRIYREWRDEGFSGSENRVLLSEGEIEQPTHIAILLTVIRLIGVCRSSPNGSTEDSREVDDIAVVEVESVALQDT
jgi:hypothetical protein